MNERCGEQTSAQLIIYQFYLCIANTEVIGVAALAYGFVLNEILTTGTDEGNKKIKIIKISIYTIDLLLNFFQWS